MISAGLVGATGYTGKKIIRFCQSHPHISAYTLYGAATAGKTLWQVFPDLMQVTENMPVHSAEEVSLEHDAYFVMLPHGEAMRLIPGLLAAGKKVIDLGGDFRLDSPGLYPQWYGFEHSAPALLLEKLYGLADYLEDSAYQNARLIANPGCYPTAVLLSLLPLIENFSGFVQSVSTVAYSGASGAGKAPRADLLLSEMYGNAKAYAVNAHRHQPEITQLLHRYTLAAPFTFTAHLLPTAVGIYATTVVHLTEPVSSAAIRDTYQEQYSARPFVRMRNVPPELQWVVNTNFCDINVNVAGTAVVITAAIDNLIKGAAGQAVQNLNRLFGWFETTGITATEARYALS